MDQFRFDQVRYLAAKKSVDDRSLNRHVWERLLAELARRPAADEPFAIVELGAGIGTMIERLADWGLFEALLRAAGPTRRLVVSVDLVDEHGPSIEAAAARLPAAGRRRGYSVTASPSGCRWSRPSVEIEVRLHRRDIGRFAAGAGEGGAQLVITHAVLDLFDLQQVVPLALALLAEGGHLYAPVTFDGLTVFEPTVDGLLDAAILARYHQAMDERMVAGRRSGDARAGRHLYHVVSAHGAEVLALGSSDWLVFPTGGRYPEDEAYFLVCILSMVAEALEGDAGVGAEALERWMARRRGQVDAGELVYIAHQVDLLARRAGPAGTPG